MLAEERYQQVVDQQNSKYRDMSPFQRRQQLLRDAEDEKGRSGSFGAKSPLASGGGGQQHRNSFKR